MGCPLRNSTGGWWGGPRANGDRDWVRDTFWQSWMSVRTHCANGTGPKGRTILVGCSNFWSVRTLGTCRLPICPATWPVPSGPGGPLSYWHSVRYADFPIGFVRTFLPFRTRHSGCSFVFGNRAISTVPFISGWNGPRLRSGTSLGSRVLHFRWSSSYYKDGYDSGRAIVSEVRTPDCHGCARSLKGYGVWTLRSEPDDGKGSNRSRPFSRYCDDFGTCPPERRTSRDCTSRTNNRPVTR